MPEEKNPPGRATVQKPVIDLNKIGIIEIAQILRFTFKGNITKKYLVTSKEVEDHYIMIRIRTPKKQRYKITITDTAHIKLNQAKYARAIKSKSEMVSWLRKNCPIDLNEPRVRVYVIDDQGTHFDERFTRIFDHEGWAPAPGSLITMSYWGLPSMRVKDTVIDIGADDSTRTIVYLEKPR